LQIFNYFYDFLQVPSQAETKAEGKKAGGLLLCAPELMAGE